MDALQNKMVDRAKTHLIKTDFCFFKIIAAFEQEVSELGEEVEDLLKYEMSPEKIIDQERRVTNVTTALDILWEENPYATNEQLNIEVHVNFLFFKIIHSAQALQQEYHVNGGVRC